MDPTLGLHIISYGRETLSTHNDTMSHTQCSVLPHYKGHTSPKGGDEISEDGF